jgi:hypothetical protein
MRRIVAHGENRVQLRREEYAHYSKNQSPTDTPITQTSFLEKAQHQAVANEQLPFSIARNQATINTLKFLFLSECLKIGNAEVFREWFIGATFVCSLSRWWLALQLGPPQSNCVGSQAETG